MLIHNTLPSKYNHYIQFVYNNYKNNNLNGDSSLHYWIDNIKDELLF